MRSIVVPSGPRCANSDVAASRILRLVPSVSQAMSTPIPTLPLLFSADGTTVVSNATVGDEPMSLHTAPAGNAPATPSPVMSRGLTLLLAITGGVAIGNLYWAQPLLKMI